MLVNKWFNSWFCFQRFNPSLIKIAISVAFLTQSLEVNSQDLIELSLEELANIQITSVSKRRESINDAAASIFVITNNDIQRSGVSSLPEALRLAPNLQVAQDSARNYAITARGFNSVFNNKLLVLIDGRTVYSPLFSGVFWDAQDVVLEDIDRIEVISGAGATLWGANAVNGVINIITKTASQTQGGLVSLSGSGEESYLSIRYGGALDNGGNFRVYGKHADRNDNTNPATRRSLDDGFNRDKAGFRSDWVNENKKLTLQGDFYDGYLSQSNTNDIQISGANLLARMNTTLSNGSNLSLQGYLDYTYRKQPATFKENLTTADIEVKHDWKLSDKHNFTWGGGYRAGFDRLENDGVAFMPASKNLNWGNVFAQDEIMLTEKLRMILGMKLEHNNYTGLEYLPNARLAWKFADNQLLWTSASRSVHAPSRIDKDFIAPGFISLVGGPHFGTEKAYTYEVGYRATPTNKTSISVTGFYTEYDELRTLDLDLSALELEFKNKASARSHGLEMWGAWQVIDDLKLSGGLVVQDVRLNTSQTDILQDTGFGINDASSHSLLRISYDISPNHLLDATARYMGKLRKLDVPAYTALDIRYGWKINKDLEFSIVGQNLLDSKHIEYADPVRTSAASPEYDRRLFAKVQWYFR
ncbi:MAG: TonB-dependent receptor [Methylotenera sp.]|nr:MAG: TonB-dependent receptor [Methylotenera sp.]